MHAGLAAGALQAYAARPDAWRFPLTLCPIAIVAGCSKCPAVSVCPLKTVLGNAPKEGSSPAAPPPAAKASKTSKKR